MNKYFTNPYKTSNRKQIIARIIKEENAEAKNGVMVGVKDLIWIKCNLTHRIKGVFYTPVYYNV